MASSQLDTKPTHLALFYGSEHEYVDGVLQFAAPAVQAGEPVAVAVPGPRAVLLEARLRELGDPEMVELVQLGHNPARIIPAVEAVLGRHPSRRLHYVCEPIWAGRSAEEISEATRHEALINLAWPEADIHFLCPYDLRRLDPVVLQDAERTHPHLIVGGTIRASLRYRGPSIPLGVDRPLPDPPAGVAELGFELEDLVSVRALVSAHAAMVGMAPSRVSDLVLAVNELATNTIRHGAGHGVLRVWSTLGCVICQVDDSGHIADPLAGRRAPVPDIAGGLGLWTVNQLCDLVEVRTSPAGTAVRVHASL
jgi:anti-sigma regulatory factor (Ser/Thr protein kinase)